MHFTTLTIATLAASLASAQTLNIPARVGSVQRASNQLISANRDFGNAEFDSGVACDTGEGGLPVFRIADGVTISNLIIGPNQVDGIHCLGRCTIRNVWFRNVCEDAITGRGAGDILIEGGGATGASDKVVQHNARGRITIRNYTVTNSGKLYRSCGNCSNNQANSPRHVTIENVRASGMTSDLVGINNNFGDTATISGSCGSNNSDVCENYLGIESGNGDGGARNNNNGCGGAQGTLATLPAC
ncbi:putative pectate lyase E [Boeremia exigua]|uniref:putative pectate lyase E n=1 Tax=Boeremia exigua TaxID=749465 RepID=UPI001E8D8B68|nr:putative pectate lyase E [Boeremia exigua]KAH6619900.1 putative pectate lyase E [Boeremia exigua]